jgi:CHAT domain-containing protein
LATHGGELNEQLANTIGLRLSRQPMYRGYLLLGGAEESLAAWRHGVVLPLSQDGLLTAEEVGGLDLGGTWLTVLSACRSGAGEARGGEGILGLRRGFALAGTEYLVFTLWPVNDAATARFMKQFYQRIFQQEEPALAFYRAQIAELRRLRQEQGLSTAVYQAGGLVLTR